MAVPWNIPNSGSQLFYLDKEAADYKALLSISHIPHPDRSLLGAYIQRAKDPQVAARNFLRRTSRQDDSDEPPEETIAEFLDKWKTVVEKFRPIEAEALSTETKQLVYERDGACCCVTRDSFQSFLDPNAVYVHVIPPSVFEDPKLSEGAVFSNMLAAHTSVDELNNLRLILKGQKEQPSGNLWLLHRKAFDLFRTGQLYFPVCTWAHPPNTSLRRAHSIFPNDFVFDYPDWCQTSNKAVLENRTPQCASILNEDLLNFQCYISKSLLWIEMSRYLGDPVPNDDTGTGSESRLFRCVKNFLLRAFCRIWTTVVPQALRARLYNRLIPIGLNKYSSPHSMTTWRLPFGLYLRKSSPGLARNNIAEFHALRMVEKFTRIPAPRALDVFSTPKHSYLLMTRVPGRPIGPVLSTMTDNNLEQVVIDLKDIVSQLRSIPNKTTEGYQICNVLGQGFLDWRIGDSQREELRFKSETEFNKYLTDPLIKEVKEKAVVSHDISHEITFTHGDLNPRNILVDENRRICGVVDWENAGFFPEYWEYSKMHYTVRSLIRWLADVVDRVFEGYRKELHVENMLSDALGPF
ncbi:hypothetical protein FQN57_004814 [Myotisia sp. PD_48]|nr:hypothetical protein FQN57_004814 [Myotisia sp. PD_48]